MAKFRVPIYKSSPTKSVLVDPTATAGAVVGINLRWQDGTLVTRNELSGAGAVQVSPNGDTTDDIEEGQYNLYFTTARAQAAAVDNAITPGVTNKAPSEDAVAKALANVPTGVPYYVPAADTFVVPANQQVLFSDPITLDGDMVVNGRLIDVSPPPTDLT